MLTINFNESDVSRILGKLNKIKANVSTAKNGALFNLVMRYTTEYYSVIVKAMQSVEGDTDGGLDLGPFHGRFAHVYWDHLAPYTVLTKERKGLSLYIWNATGKTQNAVRLETFNVPYQAASFFAGIDGARDKEAFRRAINTEFGAAGSEFSPDPGFKGDDSSWPSRPLFTIANSIFVDNKHYLLQEIKKQMLEGVNWGSS